MFPLFESTTTRETYLGAQSNSGGSIPLQEENAAVGTIAILSTVILSPRSPFTGEGFLLSNLHGLVNSECHGIMPQTPFERDLGRRECVLSIRVGSSPRWGLTYMLSARYHRPIRNWKYRGLKINTYFRSRHDGVLRGSDSTIHEAIFPDRSYVQCMIITDVPPM